MLCFEQRVQDMGNGFHFFQIYIFLDAWERCESLWVKEMWIKLQSSQQWNSSGLGRREAERKISLVAPSGNEIEWQFRAI